MSFLSAIPIVGPIIDGIVGYNFNESSKSNDRSFQREMYQRQLKDNRANWNMQNDYNLPTNQYNRMLQGLKDNNLNPNLVYGSGGVIGSTQAQMPQGASASGGYSTPYIPKLDFLGGMLQLKSFEKDIELKDQRIETEKLERYIKEREIPYNLTSLRLSNDMLTYQIDNTRWQSLLSGIEYTIANKYGYDKAENEVIRVQTEIAKIEEEILNYFKQRQYTEEQIRYMIKQQEVADKTIEEIMSRIGVNKETARNLFLDGIKKDFENSGWLFKFYSEMPLQMYSGAVGAKATGKVNGWLGSLQLLEENYYNTMRGLRMPTRNRGGALRW